MLFALANSPTNLWLTFESDGVVCHMVPSSSVVRIERTASGATVHLVDSTPIHVHGDAAFDDLRAVLFPTQKGPTR